MKKLAIFFPGIGYHADKPLLYYSRKLAGEAGYELIALKYDYQAGNIRGNKDGGSFPCIVCAGGSTACRC